MTPQEFKAWFDGYAESIAKQPTQKQWKRIQEMAGDVSIEMVVYPPRLHGPIAPDYVSPTIAPQPTDNCLLR